MTVKISIKADIECSVWYSFLTNLIGLGLYFPQAKRRKSNLQVGNYVLYSTLVKTWFVCLGRFSVKPKPCYGSVTGQGSGVQGKLGFYPFGGRILGIKGLIRKYLMNQDIFICIWNRLSILQNYSSDFGTAFSYKEVP